MSKRYIVSIPLVGAMHIEVSARTASEAKEKAWRAYDDHGPDAGEVEWELTDHVTTGNVCHAPQNDIEANEAKP